MKAWLLKSQTGLDALEFHEDAPTPEPGPGEVRLALRFAALNPADYYLARKQYPARPTLPHILGRDGAGVVDAVGEGVVDVKVGDVRAILRGEVGVSRPGTLAEYVCVPADLLVPVPDGWTEEQAAAAPLVYLTAWQALTQWGDFASSVILVTGATGGVGLASVQLAKALGHRVIALSRSEEKGRRLSELGADLVLDPGDAALVKKVKDFSGDDGVRLVVDNVAGALFNDLLGTLGYMGAVSCVGRLAGPVPDFNTARLFFNRLRIGGVAVGTYTSRVARESWDDVLACLNESQTRPVIDTVFPLDEVPEAFDRLIHGPFGKVVIRVG